MSDNSTSIGGNVYGPVATGDHASAVSHGWVAPAPSGQSGQRADRADPARSRRQAFLSYQRADRELVEPILAGLRAAELDVWYDGDLVGGTPWPLEVSRAIRTCAAFIACFSPRYADRHRSYMNEELRQAIEQRRLMPAQARWLVPIIIEPCELPELTIDSTTTLSSLQHIDFSVNWPAAMTGLVNALRPLV
jgi:hypothetical protein